MERHQKCKLCFKIFANGRALGGHMRSHMLNLPLPQKQEEDEDHHLRHDSSVHQLSKDTESASASSSSSEEDEDAEDVDDDEKGLYYGLRENPKRSVRLVDPEFSFAVEAAASVVVQDRESETESSKNPTRRRSKRTRKLIQHHQYHLHQPRQQEQENNNSGKLKFDKKTTTESWVEPEPVTSSISDTTTEEDVAFCLMMLSRDKWKTEGKRNHHQEQEQDDDDEEEEAEAERSIEETDESEGFKSCKTRTRGKYRCGTCNKVFKSYQALGGHRASHKKLKLYAPIQQTQTQTGKINNTNHNKNGVTSSSVAVKRLHECPYCFRVFSSGQALGGHKRTHVLNVAPITPNPARSSTTTKIEDSLSLIDLNLPAPVDEDDLSQVELSAVSEAEFVNHTKR